MTRSETLLGRPVARRHSHWKEFSQEETEETEVATAIHLHSHFQGLGDWDFKRKPRASAPLLPP